MADRVHCAVAEARALAALPVDVLALILKDMSLKERLRLETLDKNHRDALRVPELWEAIDLEALCALNCTEDQLLSLLSRVEPRMQRGAAQIRRMAESLDDVTESFTKHMVPEFAVEQLKRKTRTSFNRDFIFIQLVILRFLYKAVPESWGPVRFFFEACTLWLVDQLQRIPLAVRSVFKFLRNVKSNPSAFVRNGTSSPLEKPERQRSAKKAVLLDVSGAVNLSPTFIAACAIALSAAGFQGSVRMDEEGDPGFLTNHPVFEVTRSLALDCAFLVNLKVSGAYPWKANCLTPFNPWGRAQEPVGAPEEIETKLERVAASIAPQFEGSRAAYELFLGKISSLVELRAEIAGSRGRRRVANQRRDGESFRAGTVTVQHHGHVFSRNSNMACVILGSPELQASQGLRALALDFPLSLADLDSVALFLDRNATGAHVVGGARVPNGTDRTRAAEWGGTAADPRGGLLEHAFLTPLQQELRFEGALRAADRVFWGIGIADVIFGLVLLLDYLLARVRFFRFVPILGIQIMIQVLIASVVGWPHLRAAIQGDRDPINFVIVAFAVGFFLFLPFAAAWRALYFYLCACLAWTVLKWFGTVAVECRAGLKIKARVKR
ncbi:hypothetical protein KFL_011740020 [Klebsormidium nitens]|uniref:F-box domain-containing protein n=1 Tax=Klebsormidium nitens TaxID=105231 RepID=A0A1Y1IVH4_KLENI|nr:hypothetical protein KFL_011740020 [Klebsormidium nitens]|eukprot:GAQ92866.1 hypothetical protein KFL_011740020 [Klebsormidium nitens]